MAFEKAQNAFREDPGDFVDYYEMLGLKPNATEKEIRAARKKLQKIYHPDKNFSAENSDEIIEYSAQINAAAKVLLNPRERENYNEIWTRHYFGSAQTPAAAVPASTPAESSGFPFVSRIFSAREHSFSDRIFIAETALLAAFLTGAALAKVPFPSTFSEAAGTIAAALAGIALTAKIFKEKLLPLVLAGLFNVILAGLRGMVEPLREQTETLAFVSLAGTLVCFAGTFFGKFEKSFFSHAMFRAAALLAATAAWKFSLDVFPLVSVNLTAVSVVLSFVFFVVLLLSLANGGDDD